MRTSAAGLGLTLTIACGCAPPEDAFLGSYSGTYECTGSLNGSAYTEGPAPQTVVIQRNDDGSIFQASDCSFPLRVLNSMRAEYIPDSCNVILENGTPAEASILGGVINLDEPELEYEMSIAVETSTDLLTAHCTFNGYRFE
jgi:hypothetical protein